MDLRPPVILILQLTPGIKYELHSLQYSPLADVCVLLPMRLARDTYLLARSSLPFSVSMRDLERRIDILSEAIFDASDLETLFLVILSTMRTQL